MLKCWITHNSYWNAFSFSNEMTTFSGVTERVVVPAWVWSEWLGIRHDKGFNVRLSPIIRGTGQTCEMDLVLCGSVMVSNVFINFFLNLASFISEFIDCFNACFKQAWNYSMEWAESFDWGFSFKTYFRPKNICKCLQIMVQRLSFKILI